MNTQYKEFNYQEMISNLDILHDRHKYYDQNSTLIFDEYKIYKQIALASAIVNTRVVREDKYSDEDINDLYKISVLVVPLDNNKINIVCNIFEEDEIEVVTISTTIEDMYVDFIEEYVDKVGHKVGKLLNINFDTTKWTEDDIKYLNELRQLACEPFVFKTSFPVRNAANKLIGYFDTSITNKHYLTSFEDYLDLMKTLYQFTKDVAEIVIDDIYTVTGLISTLDIQCTNCIDRYLIEVTLMVIEEGESYNNRTLTEISNFFIIPSDTLLSDMIDSERHKKYHTYARYLVKSLIDTAHRYIFVTNPKYRKHGMYEEMLKALTLSLEILKEEYEEYMEEN